MDYFVPVDEDIRYEREVINQSLSMNSVKEAMQEANTGLIILVMDMHWRNIPPVLALSRGMSRGRSESRSLALSSGPSISDPESHPYGLFIAYGSIPSDERNDSRGSNSLYTEVLLEEMRRDVRNEDPNSLYTGTQLEMVRRMSLWQNTIEAVFGRVNIEVMFKTDSKQKPMIDPWSIIRGEFYFLQ